MISYNIQYSGSVLASANKCHDRYPQVFKWSLLDQRRQPDKLGQYVKHCRPKGGWDGGVTAVVSEVTKVVDRFWETYWRNKSNQLSKKGLASMLWSYLYVKLYVTVLFIVYYCIVTIYLMSEISNNKFFIEIYLLINIHHNTELSKRKYYKISKSEIWMAEYINKYRYEQSTFMYLRLD